MNLAQLLSGRIHLAQIRQLVQWAVEADNASLLFSAIESDNNREAKNALWTLTHLQPLRPDLFQATQNQFIDRLLSETDQSKKRMLLQLLRRTDFDPIEPRGDFLDYCLETIIDETEPYAIRANCIHIARKLTRGYPELRTELTSYLALLATQPLSPGLKSALRQDLPDEVC